METNQQNQDEIEIDLLELLRVLWSKIGYVILAAIGTWPSDGTGQQSIYEAAV